MLHENWKTVHRIVKEENLGVGDLLFQKPIALVLQRVISAGLKNLKNEEKFERWGVERSFFIYLTIHTFTLVFFLIEVHKWRIYCWETRRALEQSISYLSSQIHLSQHCLNFCGEEHHNICGGKNYLPRFEKNILAWSSMENDMMDLFFCRIL